MQRWGPFAGSLIAGPLIIGLAKREAWLNRDQGGAFVRSSSGAGLGLPWKL